MKNIMKIVFTIIAAIVGAGFASGKEIYLFFYVYGIRGIFGVFISCLIISLIIFKVLKICYKNKINNYQEFCEYLVGGNKLISSILNNIVNIFLLITFFIMIAGFASLINEEFGVNKVFGGIVIIILNYIIARRNIDGLIKISNFLVPLLVAFLLFISLKNLKIFGGINNFSNIEINNNFAILKSILYACYNCIIIIPVLIIVSKKINNYKNIYAISVVNFICLIILIFSIYNLLMLGDSNIYLLEMPIIEIVKRYGEIFKIIYIILICIAIFTTTVSSGVSFLTNCSGNKFKRNLILISVIAVPISLISFSTLVNLLYPVLGIVGFFEICGIVNR